MQKSILVFALCVSLTLAQWPCQDWGFNGPIANCASCAPIGSPFFNQVGNWNWPNSGSFSPFSVCTACTTGFYLAPSVCQPCTPNCNWCGLNGACQPGACAVGYVYNPVMQTCMACPSGFGCVACELTANIGGTTVANVISAAASNTIWQASNYILGVGLSSYPGSAAGLPIGPDATYNSLKAGPYVCTSCQQGFYVSSTSGACTACPANTISCGPNTGTLTVPSTNQGVNNTVAFLTFANSYAAFGNPISISCNYSFTNTQTNPAVTATTCYPLPANCLSGSYNLGTTTATCGAQTAPSYGAYSLLANVAAWVNGITTYAVAQGLGGGCAPGYILNAGSCTACSDANCLYCTATGANKCAIIPGSCKTGFVVNTTATTGQTCLASTAANCLLADPCLSTTLATCQALATQALNLCAVCASGYALIPSTKLCTACPSNCQACYVNPLVAGTGSTAYCSLCNTGYVLVNSDTNFAVNTSTLYAWNQVGGGAVCLPLPANCQVGSAPYGAASGTANCFSCNPGYGLTFNLTTNASSCTACPAGCLSCDGAGVCTQCNITTVLAPSVCLQCPYNCSVCANATYCFNNCTKNYNYNAITGQCLPNGAEKVLLSIFALLSALVYFI